MLQSRTEALMDEYYDAIAPAYDELHGEEQDAKLLEFLENISIPPKSKVLDVGCGTGRSARLFLGVQWTGIDPSQGLINTAPEDVKKHIITGRAEQLPFEDDHFDIIISLTAIQNFEDPEAGLQEMSRVCKHNGRLLVSFLKKSPRRNELDSLIKDILTVEQFWEQDKDMMYICRH